MGSQPDGAANLPCRLLPKLARRLAMRIRARIASGHAKFRGHEREHVPRLAQSRPLRPVLLMLEAGSSSSKPSGKCLSKSRDLDVATEIFASTYIACQGQVRHLTSPRARRMSPGPWEMGRYAQELFVSVVDRQRCQR